MKRQFQDEMGVVRYTLQELQEKIARGESQTDWVRLDAMSDEELTCNAESDQDNLPLFDEDNVRMRPIGELLSKRDVFFSPYPGNIQTFSLSKERVGSNESLV